MNNLNDVYKYIYNILISYPSPDIINIKFDKSVYSKDFLLALFYQSCAKMLQTDPAHFIISMQRSNSKSPNLILTKDNIEYLLNNDFMPQIDLSTTV
jgi:hypothetical protein